MNLIMRTKIETCLELATDAADFKAKVLKVTALTSSRFDEMGLTSYAYCKLAAGVPVKQIINELF